MQVLEANNSPRAAVPGGESVPSTYDEALAALAQAGAEPASGPVRGSLVAGAPAAAVRSQALADGLVLVTDASAQLVCSLWSRRCRARGSSRSARAEARRPLCCRRPPVEGGGPSRLFAADVHAFKAEILAARMAHLGVPDVVPARRRRDRPGGACAKPPVARWTACSSTRRAPASGRCVGIPSSVGGSSPADIDALARLGERLLASAASLVNPGGFVVYSTCTLTRRENAEVIASFLESRGGTVFRDRPARRRAFRRRGDSRDTGGIRADAADRRVAPTATSPPGCVAQTS